MKTENVISVSIVLKYGLSTIGITTGLNFLSLHRYLLFHNQSTVISRRPYITIDPGPIIFLANFVPEMQYLL